MKSVSKIEKIRFDEDLFINDYVCLNRPVILQGAINHWSALSKWSLDYFSSTIGQIEIEYRISQSNYSPDLRCRDESSFVKEKFCDLIKKMNRMENDPNFYFLSGEYSSLYSNNKINSDYLTLWSDFSVPTFIERHQWVRIGLWLSTQGIVSWLHYDGNGAHNFNAQIFGRKKVMLISPDQAIDCYIYPYNNPSRFNFSQVNVDDPLYTNYPNFDKVSYYDAILMPSEVLYIPPYWLHSFEHIGKYNLNLNVWWNHPNVQLNPLAVRSVLLLSVRSVLSDKKQPLSRSQLVKKLEDHADVKRLLDQLDYVLTNNYNGVSI